MQADGLMQRRWGQDSGPLTRLTGEPPTDVCNQPHVSLSHSLPLWLMSPPDSIEAIRQ